jgi:hypothetical protein
MSLNSTKLMQFLAEKIAQIPDQNLLDESASSLDNQHRELSTQCDQFDLLPGLLLRLDADGAYGSDSAKTGTVTADQPVSGTFQAHRGLLSHLKQLLHTIKYEHRLSHKALLDRHGAELTAAGTALNAFSEAVAALTADERRSLTYFLTSHTKPNAHWRLGNLLCSATEIQDSDLVALNTTPQYLPPTSLVSFLTMSDPHPSKHTLLVHLAQTQTQTLTHTPAFQHAIVAAEQLGQYCFAWHREPHQTAPYETASDGWFWPFALIENAHVPDTRDVYINKPSTINQMFVVGYASVPYENSRQQNGSGEDHLWFHTSGKDDIFAVLTDGASQSALGGVAADALSRMCMRFHQAHPQIHINETDFLNICALAAAEARRIVNVRIEAREAQKLDATVTRILRKRNTVGGSQAVFAIVQKTGNAVRCISAGNVRVIIPGYIEHNSTIFASDEARFASLPASGLLGTYVLQDVSIPDSAFRITIHSDALEGYAGFLARRGFLESDVLYTAAQADDATYITFQNTSVSN